MMLLKYRSFKIINYLILQLTMRKLSGAEKIHNIMNDVVETWVFKNF